MRRLPMTQGRSGPLFRCMGLVISLLAVLVAGSGLSPAALALDPDPPRRVNAPYFEGDVRYEEMAIFWFGQVREAENYADVRVGYNREHLCVSVAAFDRRLWYDTSPGPDLGAWDSATLYLDLNGDGGNAPGTDDYRFVAQINWWEDRDAYQVAYQGDGSGWVTAAVPFTTTSGWRGSYNDAEDDDGWAISFYIPYASLGLSSPPPDRSRWGLGVTMHDRENEAGSPPIADKGWPEAIQGAQPATWGELAFGLPSYQPPSASVEGTTTIRHELNGADVADASVGGYTVCGEGVDRWTEWGDTNEGFYYPERTNFNIQNQSDVADWPCFSKYYVAFPLDAVPLSKVILSATLTLHQFGGSEPSQAEPSLIQVLTVYDDWDDETLTWNNAPLAVENVSAAWVDPTYFPGWPGIPTTWDVSLAVAEAYAEGMPLRLALYEADSAYHSGKYFVSSHTGDWNAEGRPTLTVVWGSPTGTVEKTVTPSIAMPGDALTYTLTVVGSGEELTLTDDLPSGVSAPLTMSPGLTYAPRRLTWTGMPGAGEQVTLSYAVTITAPSRTALWNQVTLDQPVGRTDTDAALVLVDPAQVHLPLVWR